MKVGIIGVGQVGGTLAKRLGAKGHTINLGSRKVENPELAALSNEIGGHAQVLSLEMTIQQSEVLIIATPWSALEGWAHQHRELLDGKVIIDCTNPLKPQLSGLTVSGDQSGAGLLQSWLPKSHIVKAFNTVGFNIMENPVIEGRKVAMFFCGDNENARHMTRQLIVDVGFEPIDAGNLSAAGTLESFALLWIRSAYQFGLGREFAFSIVRRQ